MASRRVSHEQMEMVNMRCWIENGAMLYADWMVAHVVAFSVGRPMASDVVEDVRVFEPNIVGHAEAVGAHAVDGAAAVEDVGVAIFMHVDDVEKRKGVSDGSG